MSVEEVDAIVLSGRSAFGLDAAGFVQAVLSEAGRGYHIRDIRIPMAPQAIIFDLLNGGKKNWGRFSPYCDLGYMRPQSPPGPACSRSAAWVAAPARPQPRSRAMLDPMAELPEIGHAAGQVMARAIARGVYEAMGLPLPGAQIGWRQKFDR